MRWPAVNGWWIRSVSSSSTTKVGLSSSATKLIKFDTLLAFNEKGVNEVNNLTSFMDFEGNEKALKLWEYVFSCMCKSSCGATRLMLFTEVNNFGGWWAEEKKEEPKK
ncbi:hypothetical protein Tco_0398253 [Tanacetum coccineum]